MSIVTGGVVTQPLNPPNTSQYLPIVLTGTVLPGQSLDTVSWTILKWDSAKTVSNYKVVEWRAEVSGTNVKLTAIRWQVLATGELIPALPNTTSPPPPIAPPDNNIPVVLIPAPVARFSWRLMADGRVQFTNESLNNPTAYSWDFGDGQTSVLANPSHQFSAGTFTVQLTATNAGGSDSDSQSVTVTIDVAAVDFSYAVGGFKVWFADLSNFEDANILWSFGDGGFSREINPIHEYAGNGTFTVTFKKGGLSKSVQITIDTEILLQWQDNSGDETGFKIEHSLDGLTVWTQIATVGAGITSLGITQAAHGIDSKVLNYFRVRAYSDAGNSDYSNIAGVQC